MGSRPPRQQPIPKRIPRERPQQGAEQQHAGLRMETITPFLGFAAFPVAIAASFIGYAASGDSRTIGGVLVITIITAVILWAVLRSQANWRRNVRMTNELLMAMLVALIGITFAIAGLAALAPAWIAIGVAIIAGAWFIQRMSTPAAS